MLNYIWGGLIISSLLFAVVHDVADLNRDAYRNGEPLPVELAFPQGFDAEARSLPVEIRVDPAAYRGFYGVEEAPEPAYRGTLRRTEEGRVLRFSAGAELPEPLATIQGVSQSRDGELQGALPGFEPAEVTTTGPVGSAPTARAAVLFDPVRFVKMNAIAQAALDFAETETWLKTWLRRSWSGWCAPSSGPSFPTCPTTTRRWG